ncbi:MAG: retropepsin-like aspartic protease [Steroidobacteraceae bacterium]
MLRGSPERTRVPAHKWRCLAFIALGAALLPLASGNGNAADDEALYAAPTRMDRIGRVVAPVMINGRGPFRLVVDTGASHSTLSPSLMQELGLSAEPGNMLSLTGVTGTAEVPYVKVAELTAGAITLRDQKLPVVWSPIMGDTDGILGVAKLTSARIEVDFDTDRIAIRTRAGRGPDAKLYRVPTRRLDNGLLVLSASVGRVKTWAVFDTGAERTLGNNALREALRARASDSITTSLTPVLGATPDIAMGERLLAPAIALGGSVRLANAEIIFGDFKVFHSWNMQDEPALLLGMDIIGVMRAFAVDFGRSEIWLAPES